MDLNHRVITNFKEAANFRNAVVTELNIALNLALIEALGVDSHMCCTPRTWAIGDAFRFRLDTRLETRFGLDTPESFEEVFSTLVEELADEISHHMSWRSDIAPYILAESEERYDPASMKYILGFTTSFIIPQKQEET